MSGVTRYDVNQGWAHAGMVEAGGLVFVSYCAGNIEGTTTEQVQGALDNLESRLTSIGLSLAASSRSTRSSPTSGRSR